MLRLVARRQVFSRLHATRVAYEERLFTPPPPPPSPPPPPLISASAAERDTVLRALRAERPSISCVYLYDALGSELFERICETPEYYLTRTEDALLARITPELLRFPGEDARSLAPTAWVECSAGNGQKVAPLVRASAQARPTTYVPMDVSAYALGVNAARFDRAADGVCVLPLVGPNADGLALAATLEVGRKTFMLIGSSLGNAERPHEELHNIAAHMRPAGLDRLLVGVDTPPSAAGSGGKTEAEVVAAYNDRQGVTAAFTLNALTHVNRVAGTDFDLADWRHVSEWCARRCAIVAHVEAVRDVRVRAAGGAPVLALRAGERIFMEQSAKYSLKALGHVAQQAGLRVARHWLSPRDFYLICEFVRD
jgi:dimethylhistidine N-methyltransferase